MLDGLNLFAARAGDLVLGVGGVEPLGVLPGKSVSCHKAVQRCVVESGELICVTQFSCGVCVSGVFGVLVWFPLGLEGVMCLPVWGCA
jgi:hypothetical protein